MQGEPFYSDEIGQFFKQLFKVLKYGEPVTVIGADSLRWPWLLPTPQLLPKLKIHNFPHLHTYDLSLEKDSELGVFPLIDDSQKVLAFLGADTAILQGEIDILSKVVDYAKKTDLKYVFFISKNVLHPSLQDYLKNIKAELTKNILYFPLSEAEESLKFIEYLADKYQIAINKKTAEYIYKECGGYFWLMKQCVRLFRDNSMLSDNLLEYDEIGLKVAHIYENFSEKEKKLLELLPNKNNLLADYSLELRHLINLKWIKTSKSHTYIRVNLLEKYLKSRKPIQDIILSPDSQIMVNNISIDKIFSVQERKLLTKLLNNPGKNITKDEIAETLWSNEWEDKYSDWAIDQITSRLRKKLNTLGLTRTIKTIRGKGITLIT